MVDPKEVEKIEEDLETQKPVPETPQEPSLEEQLAAMKDQWLRTVAESENLRRRFQKEKDDALKYASTNFARDMVGILDYLEKALELPRDSFSEDAKKFVEGVEMTARELTQIFDRHGIKKIETSGKPFDPNLHEAMLEVESPDSEPGTIVHVMQIGYTHHDRLLRPAMVTVAKKA